MSTRRPDPPDDPFLDAQLRALPAPAAPASLAPRVLARVAERATVPWWRRPILEWPVPARASALCLLALLAGTVAYLTGWIPASAPVPAASGDLPLSSWQLGLLGVQTLKTAAAMSVGAVPLMVWWVAGAVLVTLYAGCVGLGALAYRELRVRD